MRQKFATLLLISVLLSACGDNDPSTLPARAVEGTAVYFDLDADLQDTTRFYNFPFPADVRLTAEGRPNVEGFPAPPSNRIMPPVLTIAGERRGYPATAVANFRFDAALAEQGVFTPIAADTSAPVLLIDIDPNSPERGRLYPTVATTPPADAYVPDHLLTVAALPGIILAPKRTYAFVVQRQLRDAQGALLGVPLAMVELSNGAVPDGALAAAVASSLRPLWPTLDRLGIARDQVAAATVFTTTDVVADLAALSDAIVDRSTASLTNLSLRQVYPRFCELNGSLRLPQFQTGTPPYNSLGRFVYGEDGLPVVQREEEVPVVITLPRQPMPAEGYPLVAYAHGSGGLSRQVVDRGATTEVGGQPRAGEGPAHVLAAHGFATVGIASPFNPERFIGGDPRSYLNLRNLAAYPDTFRQGAIELRLLFAALRRLRVDPALLATCSGVALADGADAFRLRAEPLLMMGQSLGAQYATLLAAIEPRIQAVAPTGSGGLLSRVILAAEGEGNPNSLVNSLLGTPAPLNYLHPALQMVQMGFEVIEPIVFASRIALRPLPGHPARSIYEPVGLNDPEFPNQIYDGMALAYGTQQAGEVRWPSLQQSLSASGRDGLMEYPVQANGRSVDGRSFTAVVAQYADDGILHSHHIAAQLDAVKYQYGCFLSSVSQGGVGVVPAAAALGTACP